MVTPIYPVVQDSTVQDSPIKVEPVQGSPELIHISWDVQADATGYNVYGSYSPFYKRLITLDPTTTTAFDIVVPIMTQSVYPYFWVSKITPSGETFLNSTPAGATESQGVGFEDKNFIGMYPASDMTHDLYLLKDDEMYYYMEEMRNRAWSVIDNNGEIFDLYYRMWAGEPCVCTTNEMGVSPDFRGNTRDLNCFGTGILVGYFPHITIKAIYVSGDASFDYQGIGIKPMQNANFLTLWAPKLRKYDLVVRRSTGERYLIDDVNPNEVFRGMAISSSAKVNLLPESDILYKLTDAAIYANLAKIATFGYSRFSIDRFQFGLFV